jgi:hypothetical protein
MESIICAMTAAPKSSILRTLITQPVCRSGMLWQTGCVVLHYDRHDRTVHIIANRDADWQLGETTRDGKLGRIYRAVGHR